MTRSTIHSYETALAALNANGKEHLRRKVANNTYVERRGRNSGHGVNPSSIAIKLHATDVVTYSADGTITLDTGGYETVTTKDRFNAFLPARFRVFAKDYVWYVVDRSAPVVDEAAVRYSQVLYLLPDAPSGRGIVHLGLSPEDVELAHGVSVESSEPEVNHGNLVDWIIQYETGELDEDATVRFFQFLVDTGIAWSLQGSYGRTAAALIEAGYVHRPAAAAADPVEAE
jgi:hypothetical protein